MNSVILREERIREVVKEGTLPKQIFERFHSIFTALKAAGNFALFDIRELKTSTRKTYFRLRKGRHRAIFYVENRNYYVINVAKGEEQRVYLLCLIKVEYVIHLQNWYLFLRAQIQSL